MRKMNWKERQVWLPSSKLIGLNCISWSFMIPALDCVEKLHIVTNLKRLDHSEFYTCFSHFTDPGNTQVNNRPAG